MNKLKVNMKEYNIDTNYYIIGDLVKEEILIKAKDGYKWNTGKAIKSAKRINRYINGGLLYK